MRKLALCFLIAFAGFATAADKWIDQIQILMTEQEKSDYKKLKSEDDKQKFVEQFWARRDPSPGTPENEYRKNYEANFAQVNTMMKNERGFETDMGQTLLLLGKPADQKQEGGQSGTYGEEGQPPGKQIWTYKDLPAGVASGEVSIEFKPGERQWQFADRKQALSILEKARRQPIEVSQANAKVATEQAKTKTPASTTGAPSVASPELKSALDATVAGSAPVGIAFAALVDSFMTSTGEAFSTFAIQSTGSVPSGKVGIRVIDSTGATVTETELPFVDSTANPAEPAGYFQTQVTVKPGQYTVALAVASANQTGGVKKSLTVPDFTNKLGISSIILSKGHQQIGEAKPEKTPYTFGKIKLNPNVNRTFSKTDELFILYEAYNFQLDGAGKPNVEAKIALQKGTEAPKQLPASPANGLVTGKKMTIPTGFSLSEKLFTPGDWKVIVTLTDKTSGQTATQEAGFTIQ